MSTQANCDMDVDECASNPCHNNATCSQATNTTGVHAYRCTCLGGYANGMCGYADFPVQYTQHCTVLESNSDPKFAGN